MTKHSKRKIKREKNEEFCIHDIFFNLAERI
jgi:hypothetical protein